MSTPNPPNAGKYPASQQGRTPSQLPGATPSQLAGATPPVSTPFSISAQAAFSPRGGPGTSPQQFEKSPAVSLLGQLPHNLAFDSPSTAAALGLGGPANMSTHEAMEGFQDMRSITRDDDKLQRLEAILDILGKKKGYVSEAGLERLAQRYGFECLSEDDTAPDGRKLRLLIMAGSSTSIEVTMENDIVQSVNLTFPESSDAVVKCMEPAGNILLHDLKLDPHQSPLTKTLDKFALNFERLTVLDKLSVMPAFDCRAAMAGLHSSLQALYDWDIARVREEGGCADELVPSKVTCARNGAPVMHARNRVGLAVQYWKERRHLPTQDYHRIWQLDISCCPPPPPIDPLRPFPSARISDQWLGKDIVLDDGMGGDARNFPLDWQEPEHLALPASEEAKSASVPMFEGDIPTGGPPQVSFLMSFDPPIVLSSPDAARLYTYTGAPLPSPPPQTTFDQIVFPTPAGALQDDPSENRVIQRQREVTVVDKEGQVAKKTHLNSLYVYKHIYSMEVKEMVFSHPKQLIDMLPLLRQWAFTSVLLENSFGKDTKEDTPANKASAGGEIEQSQVDEFLSFSKASKPSASTTTLADLSMDVIIWVHPIPHFQIKFPFKEQGANITLQILENGIVDIVDENIISQSDLGNVTKDILGKALEQMEDLCKWVEWIRSRL